MKKVSIIILSYKHQNFIAKALEGVFMQKVNFPVELILCDDQSPDNTDAVIKETLKKAPHNIEIKYTRHQKNMGSTPNFYWALRQVTGNYIAFCEGDDYWIDENTFHWQSQNATAPSSKRGHEIIEHKKDGRKIHLFVRENKLFAGKAAPFLYFGPVDYVSHQGSEPMSVIFASENKI